MIIAKIHVNGVQASVKECQRIPAGAVGLKLQIDYDGDAWAGLSKTVVFRGCVIKDVVDAGTEVTIPPEVIADCGNLLQVGIYGINSRGNLVIPTLWADLGRVYYAADPSGDETTEVTLPVWAQLQAEISTLKESGSGKPGEDGATFTPSVDAEGNLSWSNNKGLANPATVNIKGPQGGSASADAVLFTKQVLTKAEQAQARTNIGAQKTEGIYELIETITLDESVVSVDRTKELDNTIYAFQAVMIRITTQAATAANSGYILVYHGGTEIAGSYVTNIVNTSVRMSSFAAYPLYGRWFAMCYGVAGDEKGNSMPQDYPGKIGKYDTASYPTITQLRVYCVNGFPVGTKIEIYGVRA